MHGVYLIEITFFSFCLVAYDKLTRWHILLHGGIDGGHISCYGLLFLLTKRKKQFFLGIQ
jgi:hypothetical protein